VTITAVTKYVKGITTKPKVEHITPKDFNARSGDTGQFPPPRIPRKPGGKASKIIKVKKKGKIRIDKLFIIMVVLNSPFFRFLRTITKETMASAGIIPQKGKYTPISIRVGKSNTRPN
jgi:hypothetical protein